MSDREAQLRKEYLASDWPSGSAGYRKFVVDRIIALESAAQAVTDAHQKERCGTVPREVGRAIVKLNTALLGEQT